MSSNKGTFVIAGASKGLGKTLAYYAAQAGFAVALLGRTKKELTTDFETIEKISTQKVSYHQIDLTDAEATKETFYEIIDIHNSIEVLVNCAATWTGGQGIYELTKESIQYSFEQNFYTAFNTIKSLLDLQENHKTYPMKIINIGATASLRGKEKMAAFSMAKSALRIFSQSLARELGPMNIHVAHLIIDGLINNERTIGLNPNKSENSFINMKFISETILHVINQDPSCWTFEWDIRPYNERW
jgi:short-subunit dehydrogenase